MQFKNQHGIEEASTLNGTQNSSFIECHLFSNLSSCKKTGNTTEALSPDLRLHEGLYWVSLVTFIISSLLVITGLAGNFFIIATITSNRDFQSHGTYLVALALADIGGLLVTQFDKRFIWFLFRLEFHAMSIQWCRVFFTALTFTRLTTSYFVILICLERFLVVWFPLKTRVRTRDQKPYKQVAFTFLLACLVAIPSAFLSTLDGGICVKINTGGKFFMAISAITIAFTTVIPSVLLVVLTLLTIAKLQYMRCLRRKLVQSRDDGTSNRATYMIMAVCSTYITLVTLFSVVFFALLSRRRSPSAPTLETSWAAMYKEVIVTSYHLNCSLNFFLYGFASTTFRETFYQLFKCKPQN